MGNFQSATKALQTNGRQLFDARALIDALREYFDAEIINFNHLDPAYAKMGDYVRKYHFEQGMLKLQLGQNFISNLDLCQVLQR